MTSFDTAPARRGAFLRRFTVALVLGAVVGCTGNVTPSASPTGPTAEPTDEQPTGAAGGTVVGPNGGTVVGPNGAEVAIPPGALTSDTAIAIEQTSAGSPPLPGTFSAIGQMFAFTPHGTTFAAPVAMTVPFDPALVPAGETPTLYKTNAQNQWEQVANVTVDADTLSAQVSSFSLVQPGVERLAPQREWQFSIDETSQVIPHNDLDRPAWEEVEDGLSFGTEVFDLDIEDDDDEITLEVFSSADGITYWASAEDVGEAILSQTQGFIKRSSDATLRFVITGATLQAVDFNQFPSDHECPSLVICEPLFAAIDLTAEAFDATSSFLLDQSGTPLLDTQGHAILRGSTREWIFDTHNTPGYTTQAWTGDNFDYAEDENGNPLARLTEPIVIDVDLTSVGVNDKFYVNSVVSATAINKLGRESAIAAYVRDPARTGGTVMDITGLELTNDTVPPPPPPGVTSPVPCATEPDPDPAAGMLQLSAATYETVEARYAGRSGIVVTREQGSTGSVSATFTAGGGTAVPGVHYTPTSITVHFADGDTAPRTVPLDILVNTNVEPATTVNLSLSDPGGCATLGSRSSAVLTILDDDQPPTLPAAFMVGGTVSGLIGERDESNERLVLEDHHSLFLEIFDNGPFTFSDLPSPSGSEYSVRVFNQPREPSQNCTVTNGTGTFTDHNVTDVSVDCVPP